MGAVKTLREYQASYFTVVFVTIDLLNQIGLRQNVIRVVVEEASLCHVFSIVNILRDSELIVLGDTNQLGAYNYEGENYYTSLADLNALLSENQIANTTLYRSYNEKLFNYLNKYCYGGNLKRYENASPLDIQIQPTVESINAFSNRMRTKHPKRVFICFYKNDVSVLTRRGLEAYTIDSYQGKENPDVGLVIFRDAMTDFNTSFQRFLVGVTRSTGSLTIYYTPRLLDDQYSPLAIFINEFNGTTLTHIVKNRNAKHIVSSKEQIRTFDEMYRNKPIKFSLCANRFYELMCPDERCSCTTTVECITKKRHYYSSSNNLKDKTYNRNRNDSHEVHLADEADLKSYWDHANIRDIYIDWFYSKMLTELKIREELVPGWSVENGRFDINYDTFIRSMYDMYQQLDPDHMRPALSQIPLSNVIFPTLRRENTEYFTSGHVPSPQTWLLDPNNVQRGFNKGIWTQKHPSVREFTDSITHFGYSRINDLTLAKFTERNNLDTSELRDIVKSDSTC